MPLHHIIVRGIEGGNIFRDNQDRYDSINRLGRILEETTSACYAWALIPNHFHLLLRTGNATIATVIRRLLTGHTIRLCYWAVQELGEQMMTRARRLAITTVAMRRFLQRGAAIAKEKNI